jgi:hypothetical protein
LPWSENEGSLLLVGFDLIFNPYQSAVHGVM